MHLDFRHVLQQLFQVAEQLDALPLVVLPGLAGGVVVEVERPPDGSDGQPHLVHGGLHADQFRRGRVTGTTC